MKDEWGLCENCPQCGGKTMWAPNLIRVDDGSILEVGQYICSICGAKSGVIESELTQDG